MRIAHCVIVGSIFDANLQNKTRLVNIFYYRDVISIAKLKTWAPCGTDQRTRLTCVVLNSYISVAFWDDSVVSAEVDFHPKKEDKL